MSCVQDENDGYGGNDGIASDDVGVQAAYRRQIEAAEDPDAFRTEIEKRLEGVTSPFRTAENFGIEEIIDPRETRPLLCEWVEIAYRLLPSELGVKRRGMRP